MVDFIAVKRMTASDLTFFERLYRMTNVGNQKSINLNADILTGVLYPRLAAYADTLLDGEIAFPLTILGPNAAPAYRVRRKILKGGAYKNWRLNGEFVYDPPGEEGRFDVLRPGDLAVFGFTGMVAPTAVTLVMLAHDAPADTALHEQLNRLIPGGKKTMIASTPDRIALVMGGAGVPPDHPLGALAADSEVYLALEDVALGGSAGVETIRRRRRARPVSPGELARATRAAEVTGADGESLVDIYLESIENAGGHWEHQWSSQTNAVSPFDFHCLSRGGTMGDKDFDIDVKSTRGPFETAIHMSLGELAYASASHHPYRIYRVFELSDAGGWLRVSNDIRSYARALLAAHDGAMPGRVRADSFPIPIESEGLSWRNRIRLSPSDDGEG